MSPLVTNYDIARIRGDLAKAKSKLAGYQHGQHVMGSETGVGPETAARAAENHMKALYVTIGRLEGELVHAMTACGAWSYSEIIKRMET